MNKGVYNSFTRKSQFVYNRSLISCWDKAIIFFLQITFYCDIFCWNTVIKKWHISRAEKSFQLTDLNKVFWHFKFVLEPWQVSDYPYSYNFPNYLVTLAAVKTKYEHTSNLKWHYLKCRTKLLQRVSWIKTSQELVIDMYFFFFLINFQFTTCFTIY